MHGPIRLSRAAALPLLRRDRHPLSRGRRVLFAVASFLIVVGLIAPAPIAGTAHAPQVHAKLASSSPPATCNATQNMLTNASFEAGTVGGSPTGWTTSGSGITDTVKNDLTNGIPTAREGENYLQASTTTSGSSVEQSVTYSTSLYDAYTFSVWVASADGSTISGSVKITGLGGTTEPDSTSFSVAGAWTQVTAPLNITQTGHTSIVVDVVLTTTGKNFDIDAAQLVKAGLQNASFEMNATNTAPTSWTATGTGTNAVVYVDSSAIDGTRLLQANTTDTSGAASIYQTVSMTPAANQSFTVSVWVRSINSTSLNGRLVVWGLGGTANENGVTTFTVGQQWTVETASLQMTYGNHTSIEAQLYLDTASNTYDIDSFDLVNTCLQNASFEQGNLPNWTASSSPQVQHAVYTGGIDDTHFLQANSTAYGGDITQGVSAAPAVNTSWNFSAWIQSAGGGSVSGRLAIFANGGTAENAVTYWTISGTGWQYLSVGLDPVQSGHTSMTVAIYFDTGGSGGTSGPNYNIDAASLQGANQSGQGAPGTPQSVATSQAGNQASLVWAQNPLGGGATSWVIYPYVNGSLKTANEQTVSDPNGTIRNATFNLPGSWFGQSVTFGVAGANSYGTGPMSSPVGFTPVSAPTQVQAVGGSTTATVRWTTPTLGQSAITGYTIQAYNAATGATVNSPVTAGATDSGVTITGLTNGTHYNFTVAANTASGTANTSVATRSNVATAAVPSFTTPSSAKSTQSISAFQTRPQSVVTADLRGSGSQDVISTGGSGVQVDFNAGDGGLGSPSTVYSVDPTSPPLGVGSWALAAGDVNGDGKPDIVTANSGNGVCTVTVLFNNGTGDQSHILQPPTLSNVVSLPSCTQADGIALGDTGSGHLDIVVGGRVTVSGTPYAAYWVLTNNGSGSFTSSLAVSLQQYTNQPDLSDTQLVDLGEGHLDIVAIYFGGLHNAAVVMHRTGNGTFGPPDAYTSTDQNSMGDTRFVIAGDINGDGKPDLIANNSSSVYLWKGIGLDSNGHAKFYQPTATPWTLNAIVTQTSGSEYMAGRLADMNGDGVPDLVLGVNTGGGPSTVEIQLGEGNGSFYKYSTSTYQSSHGVAITDMNGDHIPDIVLSEKGNGNSGPTIEDFLIPASAWQGVANGGPLTGWDNMGGGNFCQSCAQQAFQRAQASGGWPISPSTGAFFHNFTDLAIPGRLPLGVTRAYDSTAAGTFGPFGWGWSSNLLMSLSTDPNTGLVTITQENGSTVQFTASNGTYTPVRAVPATLTWNSTSSTYTFTRQGTQILTFTSAGQLKETQDRNAANASPSYGNVYAYTGGLLSTIAGAGGNCTGSQSTWVRCLSFAWSNGVITQITDNELGTTRTISYNYNAIQELTSVVDVAGQTTTFAYNDTTHQLTNLYTPNCSANLSSCNGGNGVQNDYDSQGRIDWQKDNLGNKTSYSYTASANGWTVTITTPAVAPNCSTGSPPQGCQTQEVYASGQLQSVTYGYGTTSAATWSYQYDVRWVGVTQVIDPNGHNQKATFDGVGNRLTYQDGNQSSSTCLTTGSSRNCTVWTYNSFNEPVTITDAAGVVTTNSFDANANLTRTCTPLPGGSCGATPSNAEVVTYNHADGAHPGDVTSMVDGDNNTWTYTLDAYGDRQTVTDPANDVTTSCFNTISELIGVVTPKGAPYTCPTPPNSLSANTYLTQLTYNARAQVVTTTDPLGHVTKRTYDPDANLLTLQDGNQSPNTCQTSGSNRQCTAFAYNLNDQQTTVTRADGTTLVTDINADGTVADLKDGKGNTTVGYTYDPLQRPITEKDGDGRATNLTYDGVGNVKTLTDPQSQVTTSAFDNGNRLTGITYSDGVTPNVSNIQYDPDNRRTGLTHGSATPSWTWDVLGRLTATTDENGVSLSYGYNFRNLVTSITYPGGQTVSRGYDTAGRWTSVTDWQTPANTVNFGYDLNSNLTTETFPANVGGIRATDSFGFDAADRTMSVTDTTNVPSTLFSATYARDSANQLTADSSQATNGNYAYTPLNQLCNAGSSGNTCSSGAPAMPYGFDAANNLINDNGTGQGFDAADQLCWSLAGATGSTSTSSTCPAAPTGATTYSENARGDRTGVTPAVGAATTLGYDQANRVTSWTQGAVSASYGYSADSLRTTKTVGTATNYLWDVSASLPLLIKDGSTSYITGPGGLPVEQVSATGTLFYHHDQIGSTRLLTDGNSVVQASYSFDPWGNTTTSTGTVTNPFLYAGQYLDTTAGTTVKLYAMGARWYDPTTAQFLTRDPLVALTRSPYGYVAGNPLNRSDPTGLATAPPQPTCEDPFAPWCTQSGKWIAGHFVQYNCSGEIPANAGLITGIGNISSRLGYSPRQVGDAIHSLKQGKIPGNPDVAVDPDTGEVYVELPDGGYSDDSIGNIHDEVDAQSNSGREGNNNKSVSVNPGWLIVGLFAIAIVAAPETGGASLIIAAG